MELLIGAAVLIILSLWVGFNMNKTPDLREELGALRQMYKDEQHLVSFLQADRDRIEAEYKKVLGQKKSSEVKTGQIVEQLVGFLDEFPYPDAEIKALYQPVDLIVFKEDEIVFVEVKSGESSLSEKQRKIRDLIEAKKVRFEVHRVNGKGYNVK